MKFTDDLDQVVGRIRRELIENPGTEVRVPLIMADGRDPRPTCKEIRSHLTAPQNEWISFWLTQPDYHTGGTRAFRIPE